MLRRISVVAAVRKPISRNWHDVIVRIVRWALVVMVTGLSGCGDGGQVDRSAISVSILPTSAVVGASGQLQFTAVVRNTTDHAILWQVNGVFGGNAAVGTISRTGLYTAPGSPILTTVSAVSGAVLYKSASSQVAVRAPHSIGVRTTSGLAEFFDRSNGATFTPRGNNYIRKKDQVNYYHDLVHEHSTFTVGLYDAGRTESALAAMQRNGYNALRVWLSGCCEDSIGDETQGLSLPYMANVTDFLGRAKKHGIRVILASDWVPVYGGYIQDYDDCSQFSYYNTLNLCAGGVRAASHYFHDLVEALLALNAPMEAILSYELRDYYFYDSDRAPLNWTTGTVATANGQVYDMGSAPSRQSMMDDGMVYFIDQVRATIRQVDPTALVDVGFFVPQAPNPIRVGDTHIIRAYPAVVRSTVDFVSVTPYPAELTLAQYVQNFGFAGLQQAKPVVMAEFGAWKSDYPTNLDATAALKKWQIDSCQYNFKGWLLWTWDAEAPESLPDVWSAESNGGSISHALAPALRPDPCAN
jgi:hypothetical protein